MRGIGGGGVPEEAPGSLGGRLDGAGLPGADVFGGKAFTG